MALNKTGWSDFKLKLHNAIFANELSSRTELAYTILLAKETGESGYSFGYNQMDIANNSNARIILDDILVHSTDGSGRPVISSQQRTAIKDNWLIKGASAFTSAEKVLINKALQSNYGRSKIETTYNSALDAMILHIDTVISSVPDSVDKHFLQGSTVCKLLLADYHNQFNLESNGSMAKFLRGQAITSEGRKVQKEGALDWYDIMLCYANFKQSVDEPAGQIRRAKQVVTSSGLSSSELVKHNKQVDDAFAGRRSTSTSEDHNGNFAFPYSLNDSSHVTSTTCESYYNHIEKGFQGGYYPVGANCVWHGGVHIKTGTGPNGAPTPFVASTKGKIIGVRLAPTKELSMGKYGSHNFMITEHEHGGKKYYCLYMHLHPLSVDANRNLLQSIPWLQKSGDPKLVVNTETDPLNMWRQADESTHIRGTHLCKLPKGTEVKKLPMTTPVTNGFVYVTVNGNTGYVKESFLKTVTSKTLDEELARRVTSGQICHLSIPITVNTLLWYSGLSDTDQSCNQLNARMGDERYLLHWEIFSKERFFSLPSFPDPIPGDKPYTPAEANTWRVVEVKAERTVGGHGAEIKVGVTKLSHKNVSSVELNQIRWKIINKTTQKEIPSTVSGPTFTFRATGEGERTICIMPYRKSATETVSVTIQITKDVDKGWRFVEDDDDDYFIDNGDLKKIFAEELQDHNLCTTDISKVYKTNPNHRAELLRNYACKFVSEWGITNLAGALGQIPSRPGNYLPVVVADHQKYNWWKDAFSAGVPIPQSSLVWHYHPVRFLEEVSGVGEQAGEQPTVVPYNGTAYGGYELRLGDTDVSKKWGGAVKSGTGTFVKELQADLFRLGYWVTSGLSTPPKNTPMTYDGDYGKVLYSAVKTFQYEHKTRYNLTVTGILDSKTAQTIKSCLQNTTFTRPGILVDLSTLSADKFCRFAKIKPNKPTKFFQLPPSPTHLYKRYGECIYSCGGELGDCYHNELWGSKEMIDALIKLSNDWRLETDQIEIGDISAYNAVDIGHRSHMDGYGVDVRSNQVGAITKDGSPNPQFNKEKSVEFARKAKANGFGRIFTQCPHITGTCNSNVTIPFVTQIEPHMHHMHLDLWVSGAVGIAPHYERSYCAHCSKKTDCNSSYKRLR